MGEGNRNTALIILVIVLVAAGGMGIICCGGVVVWNFMPLSPVDAVTPTSGGDTSDVQAESTPADEAFSHTIAVETEYYLGGPQQAQPPDGTFKAGTKVRLVEDAGSYCVVESEDGVRAHVVVDAVKPISDVRQE
jgi:hypothetical protein